MNESIMRQADFNKEMDNVAVGKCTMCSKNIDWSQFRNAISKKEFRISGLCQECQDDVFGRD